MVKFKDDNFLELIKGGGISFLLKGMGMIIGYLVMIFITNKYGANGYGEYTLLLTVLGIVMVFSKFGMDISIVRVLAEIKLTSNKRDIIKVLIRILIISITIGGIVTVFLLMIPDKIVKVVFKDNLSVWNLKQLSYLVIPSTLILLIAGYFQAYKKTTPFILFNAILINIFLLLILFFFELIDFDKKPIFLYSVAVYLTFFIAVITFLLDVYKREYSENQRELKKYKTPEILNLSFPMLLAGSFVLFINWSDIIMLSFFFEEKHIGIYNASQRLADISGIALFAVNAIATPKFAEFFSRRDMNGLERTVVKSTKLILIISLPIILILVVFPKTILRINGAEFVSGYLALIFLCVGKFFNSIAGSVGYILQMTNNQKIFRNVMVFAALLNVMLNFLLIPKFNYNGAALASMITVITWNVILILVIKKRLGFWTFYNPYRDISSFLKRYK